MLAMKFGGTSMGSPESLQKVAEIIKSYLHDNPVVIVSAVSGTTDQLINIANLCLKTSQKSFLIKLEELEQNHLSIIQHLFKVESENKELCIEEIKEKIKFLRTYLIGVNLIKELSPHSFDYISSYGERLSSVILSHYLNSIEIKSCSLMADEFLITTDVAGNGDPLIAETKKKGKPMIQKLVKSNKVPVITGFFGKSLKGHITTLGRGGSDYSASIVGTIINATEIQIWTDVSGIYTADPRICKLAVPHKIVSFKEASELARFGAKVIHPRTILPAIESKIPIVIKNTFQPEAEGTTITFDEHAVKHTVKSIATKKGVTLITIETPEMLMTYGFLSKVFNLFNEFNVPVDIVATSEISVSCSVESTDTSKLVKELQKLGTVTIQNQLCILAIVGIGLKGNLKLNAKILDVLAKSKVEAQVISQGSTQNNFSLIIKELEATKATQKIHTALFEQ
jgi:aspartate kinase